MNDKQDNNFNAEVIIIGGGAAGATAALVLGRQQRETILIDSGDYRNDPSPAINMLAASNHISPKEYQRNARAALAELDTVLQVRKQVESVSVLGTGVTEATDRTVGGLEVRLQDGRTLRAQRLILATGMHDQLGAIPGVAPLWGTKVLHCPYCHGWEVRGKQLAVIANDNPMASFQAQYLRQQLSDSVTLVEAVTAVREVGEQIAVESAAGSVLVDAAFYRAPEVAAAPFATQLGLRMEGERIVVNDKQQSSNPLVYAAGDCCVKEGTMAMPFVVHAQADGHLAGLWVDQELFTMRCGDLTADL